MTARGPRSTRNGARCSLEGKLAIVQQPGQRLDVGGVGERRAGGAVSVVPTPLLELVGRVRQQGRDLARLVRADQRVIEADEDLRQPNRRSRQRTAPRSPCSRPLQVLIPAPWCPIRNRSPAAPCSRLGRRSGLVESDVPVAALPVGAPLGTRVVGGDVAQAVVGGGVGHAVLLGVGGAQSISHMRRTAGMQKRP